MKTTTQDRRAMFQKLRDRWTDAGGKSRDLADAIGRPRQTITHWYTGSTPAHAPGLEDLAKLAGLVGMELVLGADGVAALRERPVAWILPASPSAAAGRKPKTLLTPTQRAEVVALRGVEPAASVAARFDVSSATVVRIWRLPDLAPRPRRKPVREPRSHCVNGHPRTPETINPKTGRCRECARANARERYKIRTEQANQAGGDPAAV